MVFVCYGVGALRCWGVTVSGRYGVGVLWCLLLRRALNVCGGLSKELVYNVFAKKIKTAAKG